MQEAHMKVKCSNDRIQLVKLQLNSPVDSQRDAVKLAAMLAGKTQIPGL